MAQERPVDETRRIIRPNHSTVLPRRKHPMTTEKRIGIPACAGWIVCALGMLVCSCAAPRGLIEKSGEWDRIQDGEYLVENCTWNVGAACGKWHETIFCDTTTGSRGWRWDFSGETNGPNARVVKTYPEIIFGRKPFEVYRSTSPRLPIGLDSARFRLEYEYAAKADGIYNTTTDISFTDSRNPGPANIRAKLMIWFDRRNMPFFESNILKRAMIGGLQHEVFIDTGHVGPEGKWVFIAMLPDNLPARGVLYLREYFDYCLSEGALKPEWLLSSIEAGSEIASGKGEITFKKFIVH
jgi:hypothetical protein